MIDRIGDPRRSRGETIPCVAKTRPLTRWRAWNCAGDRSAVRMALHVCKAIAVRSKYCFTYTRRMDPQAPKNSAVDDFVMEEIESVPHLEALLLVWNNRPREWSVTDMAKALFLTDEQAEAILRDLGQRHLVVAESERYSAHEGHPKAEIIARLDSIYRREIVRISTMIHSKPSASVRAFARAFRLKKD